MYEGTRERERERMRIDGPIKNDKSCILIEIEIKNERNLFSNIIYVEYWVNGRLKENPKFIYFLSLK